MRVMVRVRVGDQHRASHSTHDCVTFMVCTPPPPAVFSAVNQSKRNSRAVAGGGEGTHHDFLPITNPPEQDGGRRQEPHSTPANPPTFPRPDRRTPGPSRMQPTRPEPSRTWAEPAEASRAATTAEAFSRRAAVTTPITAGSSPGVDITILGPVRRGPHSVSLPWTASTLRQTADRSGATMIRTVCQAPLARPAPTRRLCRPRRPASSS
jgi:hypothetical protein